ncbi:50S ribosomal protein L35 [Rickettsia akari str. Hartford]|uniref:50S ribosomal protein L35 n=2 Tax=Rickettsia akari TaxID=786 RepID=A8GP87_RICAH|nr:50S ribosomal protein L35 [Rickettsia akari str. Hartford]
MLGLLEDRPYIRFTCAKNLGSVILLKSGKSYKPFIIHDMLEITF